MMKTETNYSEYTVKITSDPAYYGHAVTKAQAVDIAAELDKMVRAQFPGVKTETEYVIGSSAVTGPDSAVIDEINAWVDANWQAAMDAALA